MSSTAELTSNIYYNLCYAANVFNKYSNKYIEHTTISIVLNQSTFLKYVVPKYSIQVDKLKNPETISKYLPHF
jgi:mannitol-1-phosphate/altronate dehydrogenase